MPSPWRDTSSWNQNRTLYALLKAFGASEATDKRDLVYALRAMSSDFGDTNDLVPDYEKSEADVVRDVFRAIYCCELECLESSLRPRSLPELIRGLQSMDGDEHLRSLLKCPPTCDIMEEVFKNRRYIPVNQDILATAAQHDDTGKIVELLLRYRGEELQIDEETFVYAAANLYGAKEVLSVLSCHNSQVIVPEQALVAAAENRHCGDVAMDFLLSLKTKDYDIAAIAKALGRNPYRYMTSKIIRNLLLRKDSAVSASALLKEFAQVSDIQLLVRDFLEDDPDFRNDPESATFAALQNRFYDQRCLETLLSSCPFKITITKNILRTAAQSANGANAMRLLLENPAVKNDVSQQEQFAVLAPFTNEKLIHVFLQHHSGEIMSSEAVHAASGGCYNPESNLGVLIRESTYEVTVTEDVMVSLLETFGTEVVQDLFQYRPKQSRNNASFVASLFNLLREEEEMRRNWEVISTGQLVSEEAGHAGSSQIEPLEARRLLDEEERVCIPLLLHVLEEPMTDEEWSIWMPFV